MRSRSAPSLLSSYDSGSSLSVCRTETATPAPSSVHLSLFDITHLDSRAIWYRSIRTSIRHESYLMLDLEHSTNVAVMNCVVRFDYLRYFIHSFFEFTADLPSYVPALGIVDSPHLWLWKVKLYTGRSSLAEARLVALDSRNYFGRNVCTCVSFRKYVVLLRDTRLLQWSHIWAICVSRM